MKRADLFQYFAEQEARILGEWKEFLSFASISTDPAYAADCERCAEWLERHVTRLGFSAQLLKTETKPVLFAERRVDSTKPSVLFYGHYDVQPVDPIELWQSDPFKPELRGERIYARGAEDNKGQLFYFLKAIEFLQSLGVKLPTIKLLIEGEEESGSAALSKGLASWSDKIKAEVLMVCDTGALAAGFPTIILGLRGVVGAEIKVSGPNIDLHSGVFGGVVYNPALAAAQLVSSMFKSDGSVAIPGFYDGVVAPSDAERRLANDSPVPLSQLEQEVGVPFSGGERAFTPMERRSFRPTLEVNGIGSGYQGAGGKTIIPSHAIVKFSMRTVAGQDPERLIDGLKAHLAKHTPLGVSTELVSSRSGGGALRLDLNSKIITQAREVIKEAFQKDATVMWEGASIPIIPLLQQHSGGEPLLVGFGLQEDQIHAPNESFSLSQFKDGMLYVAAMLSSL